MSENQLAAASAFKIAISNKALDSHYATQFDSATGSVYYIYLEAGGTSVRYGTAASAKDADISYAKGAVSTAMWSTAEFKTYLQTQGATGSDASVGASASPFTLASPDVTTYAKANATITAVQAAINKVSSQRSALGALQNRLEHTIANLDNVAENTQAAESRIRDLDMAAEMVEYSKNNILAQAGQSMLAQANQATQGVLSLLQ